MFLHTAYYGIGQFIGLCLVLLYFLVTRLYEYIKYKSNGNHNR